MHPIRQPKIVNLTGHDVTLSDGVGRVRTFPSVGKARLRSNQDIEAYIDFGDGSLIPQIVMSKPIIEGLPDPQENVLYIVSGVVASVADRDDVVSPGRSQRESNGLVVAARALIRS